MVALNVVVLILRCIGNTNLHIICVAQTVFDQHLNQACLKHMLEWQYLTCLDEDKIMHLALDDSELTALHKFLQSWLNRILWQMENKIFIGGYNIELS